MLEELRERSKLEYVAPLAFASICTGLNDKDAAFEYLEKSCEHRNSFIWVIRVQPFYDNLRSDPRFENIVRTVGL
jgi:hypothetical protein